MKNPKKEIQRISNEEVDIFFIDFKDFLSRIRPGNAKFFFSWKIQRKKLKKLQRKKLKIYLFHFLFFNIDFQNFVSKIRPANYYYFFLESQEFSPSFESYVTNYRNYLQITPNPRQEISEKLNQN